MKNVVGIVLLLVLTSADSKKFKIYKCQQSDGSVITQDRRCEVTQLQQVKPQKRVAKSVEKYSKTKKQAQGKKRKSMRVATKSITQRSPYFTFGWDQFIPKNWLLRKEDFGRYHLLLLSKTQFNDSRDFHTGLKLEVYPRTKQALHQDAFAHALTIYHQIRERYKNQLINSHFKTHKRYKIFNVEYKLNHNNNAFTEFYIDEANNDLFVLTIQSPKNKWAQHQNLADKILSHL